MPTKSKNIGGRGGARPNSGPKKKALIDKVEEGNPGGRKLKILDLPDMYGEEMPKPDEFLSEEQHDGGDFFAVETYEKTWEWLKNIGCTSLINPQLLERYAMSFARWVQCEQLTSRLGFLAKHPTTGNPIQSPYVAIGVQYMNQANRIWDEIFQVVKENCTTDYRKSNPHDDMMEKLLSVRKGVS